MGEFEPVVIDRQGGSYRVVQGGQLLLSVPNQVFETYEQDSVFPPSWRALREGTHPVRRLHWNPDSRQFLMTGLENPAARAVESFGTQGYRSFLHGFWLPAPPVLLLRPFWNPEDPYEPFDADARAHSLRVQLEFYRTLAELRPPEGWSTILNATDNYLEALGVTAPGDTPDPEAIEELSLMPPVGLESEKGKGLLGMLAQEYVRSTCPVIREGALAGLHALGLDPRLALEGELDRRGVGYQRGPRRPH